MSIAIAASVFHAQGLVDVGNDLSARAQDGFLLGETVEILDV